MIEVEQLRFSYPRADTPTLHGLDFEVADSEIFGFLGPSGAGKSTTQKIVIGLLTGYSGAIRVQGKEVRDWGSDYYELVGVSFEFPNHHNKLSALENLSHFGSLYQRQAVAPREALEMVGLQDDADKRVSDFSKGMKVRLNLARSFLHGPKILFLDEPTAGLDPVNARNVKELIERLRDEGVTVFLTTHDMVVADQLCDRVGFITDGRIRAIDAPDTFKQTYGRRTVKVEYTGESGQLETAEFELDGLGDDEGFRTLLREREVRTLHSQETTLENVFIEVTGKELRA